MAHKSLIGGTVYEKSGGTDLINGTVYEKDYGKTLVGGTAYEVGFAPDTAKVTLTSDVSSSSYCEVIISYTTPDGDSGSLSTAGTYELPIGTSISAYILCYYDKSAGYSVEGYIYLNDEYVGSAKSDEGGKDETNYIYTLNANIIITTSILGYYGQSITITEVPEGYASVNIIDQGGLGRYRDVKIDGVTYSTDTSLVVPIGTIITCSARDEDGSSCYIYLNGSTVATGGSQQATYDYAVNGNVIVELGRVGSGGYVDITEE